MAYIGTRSSLNEGRGTNPGDTGVDDMFDPRPLRRSTKAGAQTPATLLNGENRTPACIRSTKAGAQTPATRRFSSGRLPSSTALNEGRGTNPGDTPRAPGSRCASAALNEGRGTNPGDTSCGNTCGRRPPTTLNEGRGTNPGDTFDRLRAPLLSSHAQRRPGHKPRRHPRIQICIVTRP